MEDIEQVKKRFFSASTGGFYIEGVHKDMPDDVVEITEEKHNALIEGQAAGKYIKPDENGIPALFEPEIPPIDHRRASAQALVDSVAGQARERFVSPGSLITKEYELALESTKSWRKAGSPADAVPRAITVDAKAYGITDEQAAQKIEMISAYWEGVLLDIREIRLNAKAAIENAPDQNAADDMQQVAQTFINQLNNIQPDPSI